MKKKKNNPNFSEVVELKTAIKILSVDISWIKERIKALNRRITIVKNELKGDIEEKVKEVKEIFKWIIGLIAGTLLTVILTKLI